MERDEPHNHGRVREVIIGVAIAFVGLGIESYFFNHHFSSSAVITHIMEPVTVVVVLALLGIPVVVAFLQGIREAVVWSMFLLAVVGTPLGFVIYKLNGNTFLMYLGGAFLAFYAIVIPLFIIAFRIRVERDLRDFEKFAKALKHMK